MMTVANPVTDGLAGRICGLLATGDGGVATITPPAPVFGGNARKAWMFDARWADGSTLPCILLSQVAGKHVDSDTSEEFAVLRALNGSGVRAPMAVALDADGVVTGAPALVMERITGDASAVTFLKQPVGEISAALMDDFASATADLHRFDWQAGGIHPGSADPVGAQLRLWEDRFLVHRQEPLPLVVHLFQWLKDNRPEPVRLSLVHGDLRPGNFLFAGGRVTALLDWEMAHIGDPAEDIAWIYRALWSPEKFLSFDGFAARHAERAGFAIPAVNLLYYRIFSEVKFAAISLAASDSFATGKTRNLRHIDRAAKVAESVRRCFDWIDHEWREVSDAAA